MNKSENKLKILLVGTKRTCDKAGDFDLGDHELIKFPVLDTAQLKNINIPQTNYEWLLLTSPAAVFHFSQLSHKPSFKKLAVIGPSTMKASEKEQLQVNYIPKSFNAKSFSEEFLSVHPSTKNALFLCSSKADDTMSETFKTAEVSLERINIYEPVILEKRELQTYDAIAFLSSSSVQAFKKTYGTPTTKKIAAIGKKAAKSVKNCFGFDPAVPIKSTTKDTIQVLL